MTHPPLAIQLYHIIKTLCSCQRLIPAWYAEEMQIKPAVLKKAIRVAHKGNFAEATDDYSVLENILTTTGKQ